MIERQIEIATADGAMGTFVSHPERHGPHPVVIFFMDAPGIREELRDMVRRLASVGYYVMLPNLYHRQAAQELGSLAGEGGPAVRARALALMEQLSIPLVMSDADALVGFAGSDPAASDGPMGCIGYCMSGQYAVAAAVRHARVAAAASVYGTRLVADRPDSPHRTAPGVAAELYFACAEHDSYVPPDMIETLRQALTGYPRTEVEIYRDTHHGFAFPLRAAYDRAAAERHWERLFALFGRTLTRT